MWLLGAYGDSSAYCRLQSSSLTLSIGEVALDLCSTGNPPLCILVLISTKVYKREAEFAHFYWLLV